jgi:uncharacterized protein (DUF885 family)
VALDPHRADAARLAAVPSHLDALLAELADHELDEDPVLATAVGAPGHDDRLPELTAGAFARRAAADRAFHDRLEAAAPGADSAAAIDRELALATLRGRMALEPFAAWRRNPDTYLEPVLWGVHALFLHRLRPEPELVAAAVARLRQAPELVEAGVANLDPGLAHPLLVARALGQCRAAIRYVRELVPGEAADDRDRRALAEAGEVAAAAFERYGAHLEALRDRARGDFAIGETTYTALLRERERLDHDATSLRALGEQQWAALAAEAAGLARRIRGDDDWRAAVASCNDDHPASPEAMLVAYRTWTARAREFVVGQELLTLPDGERCEVVPAPHFERPVLAVASYSQPPPLSGSRLGHFFVPFPPDGTPPDELRQRLSANSHHEIPTVSVHEAYPGHHAHLVAAQASGRLLRHLFRSAYFTEGWALYAERLLRERGFFSDPRQELMHVKDRLFRAARIVVDTGLHCFGMSVDEAVTHLVERVGLPEATARVEVARYCAWPTQAAAYLTGSLAIETLRDRWLADGGGLLEFHDRLVRAGSMPVALHAAALGGP